MHSELCSRYSDQSSHGKSSWRVQRMWPKAQFRQAKVAEDAASKAISRFFQTQMDKNGMSRKTWIPILPFQLPWVSVHNVEGWTWLRSPASPPPLSREEQRKVSTSWPSCKWRSMTELLPYWAVFAARSLESANRPVELEVNEYLLENRSTLHVL